MQFNTSIVVVVVVFFTTSRRNDLFTRLCKERREGVADTVVLDRKERLMVRERILCSKQ